MTRGAILAPPVLFVVCCVLLWLFFFVQRSPIPGRNKKLQLQAPPVKVDYRMEDVDEWLVMKRAELEERSLRVQEVCQIEEERGEKVYWFRSPIMIIAEDYKFAYCRHAKVASTTLLRYFLELADNVSPELKSEIQNSSRKLHLDMPPFFKLDKPRKKLSAMLEYLQGFVTFSFVRHPFERLVSAFLNKVLGQNYNNLNNKTSGNFTKFIDIVLRQGNHFKCKEHKHKSCSTDAHWRPLYGRCAYCDMPYIIGKVETFQEDMWYIANEAGLTKRLNLTRSEDDALQMNASNYTAKPLELKTLEYFKELDQDRRDALYDFYKFDFELFDYNPEPYLHPLDKKLDTF